MKEFNVVTKFGTISGSNSVTTFLIFSKIIDLFRIFITSYVNFDSLCFPRKSFYLDFETFNFLYSYDSFPFIKPRSVLVLS